MTGSDPSDVRPYTISQLNAKVAALLGSRIPTLRVRGEVGNLSDGRGGHVFFTLKDRKAEIAAVLWNKTRIANRIELRTGTNVVVECRVTLYEARGRYQLEVLGVEQEGVGPLRQRFIALKAKLQAEGLFDERRKKPLPTLPRRAVIITSPHGAAVRDMIKSIHARCRVTLLVHPVRVQGLGAAAEIADAIRKINRTRSADLLLIGRGGGSLEDLWAFNEEALARAIATSRIPIVSAIGHEVDRTIADLVADRAVATPTAAGLVFPDMADAERRLRDFDRRLRARMRSGLDRYKKRLDQLGRRRVLCDPAANARRVRGRLDELCLRLERGARHALKSRRLRLDALARRPALIDRMTPVRAARQRLDGLSQQLRQQLKWRLDGARQRCGSASGKLHALSPLQVLSRGYSLTLTEAGAAVRRWNDVVPGQQLETRLAEGRVYSTVTRCEEPDD